VFDKVLQEVIGRGSSWCCQSRTYMYFSDGRDFEGKRQGKVLASGQNHIIPDQQQLYQDFVMSE